jgi:hypothetical protein
MNKLRFASLAFALAATGLLAWSGVACSSSSPNEGTDSGTDGSKGSDAKGQDSMAVGETAPPSDGPDTDTWNNYAKGFFSKYCVECHNATVPDPGTDPNQNFNIYSDVVGLDKTIRCGVSPAGVFQSGCSHTAFPPPGQFPISDSKGTNPKPSDAERLRIIAWINAGAPEG